VFKKELYDTFKTLGQSLLILLLIPIAMMLDWHVFHSGWEISGILQPVFLAFVLVFAAYAGVSIFQAEKKDRALEYLLALPISTWKILIMKILPRFTALVLLIVIGGFAGVIKDFFPDLIALIVVFVVGLCLSLAVESMINAVIGVLLINLIIYYSILMIDYLVLPEGLPGNYTAMIITAHVVSIMLLLVPLCAGFLMTMKKLDFKPLKWQAGFYLKVALPSMFLMITFILLFVKKYLLWITDVG